MSTKLFYKNSKEGKLRTHDLIRIVKEEIY